MNKPFGWYIAGMIFEGKDGEQEAKDFENGLSKDGYEEKAIPLYTHPVKELNNGGEPVKNATYWKRQYNEVSAANDRLKSGLYHANEQIKYLESHPAELTDEEIIDCAGEAGFKWSEAKGIFVRHSNGSWIGIDPYIANFARAILRKAQEK